MIKDLYATFIGDILGEDTPEIPSSGVLTQLAQKYSIPVSGTFSFDNEISSYLSSTHERDVLKFWEERKPAWPHSRKLASTILAIPSTSVQVERLFSIAGLILNKRSQIFSERLHKILSIRENIDFVEENFEDFDLE